MLQCLNILLSFIFLLLRETCGMFENGFNLTLQQDFLDLVFVKHST